MVWEIVLMPIRKATLWLRQWLIADVPAHIAACEFDCKSVSCPNEKFDHCERRLAIEKAINEQESLTGASLRERTTIRRKKRGGSKTMRMKSSNGRRTKKKLQSRR